MFFGGNFRMGVFFNGNILPGILTRGAGATKTVIIETVGS